MTCAFAYLLLLPLGADPAVVHLDDTRRVEVSVELSPEQARRLKTASIGFDQGNQTLRLSIRNEDGTLGPAIFARYEIKQNRLLLLPRYPLVRGVTYEAVASVAGREERRTRFQLPSAPAGKPPRVRKIYPSGDELPANCLKFYVHFSQPMREGRDIFEQITIQDDEGNVIPDPWRRVELWNEQATRLTLWIHPGRIKQGVNLREDFGPVLEPGRKYRLVVSPKVRDASGISIGQRFEKRFVAVAEDHHRPLPSEWKLTAPTAGTREPLSIQLGEPLDPALLRRFLKVYGANGQAAGTIAVTQNESLWQFAPRDAWSAAT